MPKSSPDAVKLRGMVTVFTTSFPVPAGTASNKEGGMVNLPALTGAAHEKATLVLSGAGPTAEPWIATNVPATPPVHVTVAPCALLIADKLFMFVQTTG